MEANRLIRLAKHHSELELLFPSNIKLEKARLGIFSDAAWANRHDGSSQGGRLLVVAEKDFWEGATGSFGILGW